MKVFFIKKIFFEKNSLDIEGIENDLALNKASSSLTEQLQVFYFFN
jgi:hypothetical protein